jgi:hypothetical protein
VVVHQIIAIDKIKGVTAAGSMLVVGEGGTKLLLIYSKGWRRHGYIFRELAQQL